MPIMASTVVEPTRRREGRAKRDAIRAERDPGDLLRPNVLPLSRERRRECSRHSDFAPLVGCSGRLGNLATRWLLSA